MIILISDVALGAVISAVTSGVVAMVVQGYLGSRIDKKLNERLSGRLDALPATALKLAVEDDAESEGARLPEQNREAHSKPRYRASSLREGIPYFGPKPSHLGADSIHLTDQDGNHLEIHQDGEERERLR